MPRSTTVQFVSAGMLATKKRDHLLARRQMYLNYGALTLATLLYRDGLEASVVHGNHDDPFLFAARLHESGRLPSVWPLMVSMPSFYALDWTRQFCRAVKHLVPETRIVIGGRWVTGPDPAWLGRMIPEADHIFLGLGESAIHGLLGLEQPARIAGMENLPANGLKHSLVEDFQLFQPSVETSRGCGMGCSFCEERDIPLSPLREPEDVARILTSILTEYGGAVNPYFQSSFFLPNRRWAERLHAAVQRDGCKVPWRCETRVDGMKPETVASLAGAGLKVVDLGLESASVTQLLAMNKARDPERYLRSASELLRACATNGVWVKANILLYGGETARTAAESRDWLDQHRHLIKGVSVGPVIVFGPPSHAAPFLGDLARYGALPCDPASSEMTGVTRMHLSPELDADAAEQLSLSLSRRYMDADAYFDLKSFSYYPRGFTRTDFDRDVMASDPEMLPFTIKTKKLRRTS